MHFGFISTIKWHPWGGSELLWHSTAKLALQKGNQVSACFIRPRVDHAKWNELESAGARVFHAPSKGFLRRQLTERASAISYRLCERLREQERLESLRSFFAAKPDVVLINEGGGIPDASFLEMLRKTMPKIPYIAAFHGNFDQVPSDSWRGETVQFFKNAEAVLFVAEATRRATERNLAAKLSNAHIIRNPVNLDGAHDEPWPQEPVPHFACVGALEVRWKGQDLLLEALSTPVWKRRDWRLSIFGGGENRNYLAELAAYYGLTHRVQVCGEVRDVRSIWREHHALVIPSRLESAPLVMVEAMLCGRPVISTDVGGIREWVRDGQNGFLCEAANAKSLGAALERAWEQRSVWRTMGARAHRDALRLYDPEPAETMFSMLAGEPKPQRRQLALAAAL